MSKLRYLGQSCFLLRTQEGELLFDPYLSKSPHHVSLPEDANPSYIFVSHGHADHVGDTVELAGKFGSTVITTAEMGRYLEGLGCSKVERMHIGGGADFPFGRVKITPALHGCGIPGGVACGFLVKTAGITIYFAGDTGLFGDMSLLGMYHRIDYALLPIGDRFTMGPEDAVIAAQMLKARYVIPMHYNANALTRQDPELFAGQIAKATGSRAIVMKPNEEISLVPSGEEKCE